MGTARSDIRPERQAAYAFLLRLLAFALAYIAFSAGGWAWLLLWLVLSLLVLSFGYGGVGARIFGKRRDGTLPRWSKVLFLPFLLTSWTLWHLQRLLSREAPFHQVSENLLVGRRLLAGEFPKGVVNCVDLTAEFEEAPSIRAQTNYVSLPILDGGVPRAEMLDEVLRTLPDGPTYVHCAQGHGRTALFAMAYLLHHDAIRSYGEGISLLRAARPRIALSPPQKAFVRKYLRDRLGAKADG